MSDHLPSTWTRRQMLRRLSAAAGAGLLGFGARPALAEPGPETRSIRLLLDPENPILCYAPQYLAEEFLHLEGFTDVRYNGFGSATSDSEVLVHDRADLSAGLGSDYIVAIDSGAPIVVLSGMHAGCVEVFASDRVRDLRDLAGKRVVINAVGGPEHIFLSTVATFVGLDPSQDIEWVLEPDYAAWPELLETGQVDVVNAFPPLNLELREKRIGNVVLNTTTDDPWRYFFCCMVAARREFVENYPVATKRALRALVKASQVCETDRERAARLLVERGATHRYEYALKTLEEVPYGAWRSFDPRHTLRFYALRLREAGLIEDTPSEILERGTDFRFIDELRREIKV
jgi:NitT/TauT family transport system substrate-binding protein